MTFLGFYVNLPILLALFILDLVWFDLIYVSTPIQANTYVWALFLLLRAIGIFVSNLSCQSGKDNNVLYKVLLLSLD